MDSDRLAGTLLSTGAILGIAGTIPTPWLAYGFPLGFLAAAAFAFALLFGLVVFWKRSSSPSLAGAGILFASLGGFASVGIIWFGAFPSPFSELVVTLASLGVLGMCVSVIGGAIGRLPESERSGGRLLNRTQLGAVLVCAGAALGLIGSRFSLFGPLAFLNLFCFALVLFFGVLLFQNRPESRLLAAATLYFATVAGGAQLFLLGFIFYWGISFPRIFSGPIGVVLAIAGAVIRLVRGPSK